MVCLEEFYERTGLSKVLFGYMVGLFPDTLKKYERGHSDHMRKSSIEKIETGVEKTYAKDIRVEHHAFSQWPHPRWTIRHSEGVIETREYNQLVGALRNLISS